MEKAGIIRKVNGPTEWVNSLVIVEKPDSSLRLCLDPKNLNENIRREHFQLPTREELEAELTGAKYFSKLDAKCGFYQIPLDKKSEEYCVFNTCFGRYCFTKLSFGLASSAEVFHKRMVELLDGLEGVVVYLDDILIWGRTLAEHNERLMAVLLRILASGITLNIKKCYFGATEITFMGDRIGADGIRPDDSKITAVLEMPTPTSKAEVMRALGTINYLSKYIPNLSSKSSALRSLLKKDMAWCWEHEHQQEWEELKQQLVSHPILRIYDPRLPTKVSVDASGSGLGAILQQQENQYWRPVAYASRTLTDVEQRYAPIEKEALALVFGFQRFHNYIYGRCVIAETDHKPLTSIVTRNLNLIPPRLQRMFMKLLKYEFELVYVPGKLMVLPDTLSRAPSSEPNDIDKASEQDIQIHVNLVMSMLPVSDNILKKIQEESSKDEEIKLVVKHLANDEPLPSPYQTFKDELSVVNGILLKSNRIVIPRVLRPDMLRRIHEGHLGLEKCRSRARQSVFWPGLSRDLENLNKTCPACNKFHYQQAQEPLLMREVPNGPWIRIGTDLFQYGRHTYIVVYDAYSNYPEVELLKETSTTAVVEALGSIFSRHGIPVEVDSDGGPQFSSKEFSDFANRMNFRHVMSSPYYPRSNGLAEKGVQVVKRLLKKSMESGDDFNLALLNYRSTPLMDGRSPGELLMGRRLRTRLPILHKETNLSVLKKAQHLKGNPLTELTPGETVRLIDQGKWKMKGQVVKKVAPRSYVVKTEHGGLTRRNRVHLLRTQEKFDEQLNPGDPGGSSILPGRQHGGPGKEGKTNVPLRISRRNRRPPNRLDL